ncbi:16S rRNA (cytosine967-C5)-methyltransferase [Zymomonas mobilis]|uniref:RsmB/NOP family class I SAM-dependent RNA methyltransferase n=1 Tax=Zymomonas mobilis TaxID=542 RepID=UPI00026D8278|nr:RsmB/NOP family class I SAM-dependent RNA methyltransferase [Zymomonas mobilis]AFN55937.1 Fmu (Sun) domain protein [Zymomonas mobilis subsp. mobilis ATCC 29191]TQK78632.1 16S rRNA (cytosine967-C5)-methyltransferase [Zymomonas mobilis]TQL16163.1 16S rRNA (cytosine967-C5)-methyltransferase [Zymomonas mobilis]GEB86973.1 MFS transporter [Zymomonas mobilis subsp. mobilis]
MIPQARVEAAIELLDQITKAVRDEGSAADRLISQYFKTRRYAGSKDRAAIRELVYRAIRHTGNCPANGRAAMVRLAYDDPELAALFDGSTRAPKPITPKEWAEAARLSEENTSLLPAWLAEKMAASDIDNAEQNALLGRAPLDIRINPHLIDLDTALESFPEGQPIPDLPHAIRLPEGSKVDQSPLWKAGAIEIQDAGSQWATFICQAKSGMNVLDLCAGAGGKTLALASDMLDDNADADLHLIACDTDRNRLSRLQPRAERAKLPPIEQRLLNPKEEEAALEDLTHRANLVLVDAPCSGSGTWRRNPEARWRLNPTRLQRVIDTQSHLLDVASQLVRPNGYLVYVVCSLLDDEGTDQIAAFLNRHPDWEVEKSEVPAGSLRGNGRRFTVLKDQTDGFFVSRLRYIGR